MNNLLQSGSMRLVTIMGIPIRVHFSWLIVFGLITWSLSTYYFPNAAPQLPGSSYWVGGIVAALMLFISVALHELSHSFIALRHGIPITGITLFIFGGVAQMEGEPPDPEVELKMAIAGPLSSLVLSLIFFLLSLAPGGEVLKALFHYLSQLNLILGLFNLIPGFPMDGGRVMRAYLWKKKGDFYYATRKAAGYGKNIAVFFIGFGVLSIFTGFPGGLWLMLIGWFLHSAAQSSYVQAGLKETLMQVRVKDMMVRDVVTLVPDTTLEQAVNDYFLKYGYGGFPVVRDGRLLGMLTLKEFRGVSREIWKEKTVAEVFVRHDRKWEVNAEDDAWHVLELMIREDQGRLAVVDQGSLSGLITRNGIAKYVQITAELKG